MDETILTSRQYYILNLINQSQGLSREEIQKSIDKIYPISKPTLIRDLNILISNKLIKTIGQARAKKYYPKISNPLLRRFDVEKYFLKEPDDRLGVKRSERKNKRGGNNDLKPQVRF